MQKQRVHCTLPDLSETHSHHPNISILGQWRSAWLHNRWTQPRVKHRSKASLSHYSAAFGQLHNRTSLVLFPFPIISIISASILSKQIEIYFVRHWSPTSCPRLQAASLAYASISGNPVSDHLLFQIIPSDILQFS